MTIAAHALIKSCTHTAELHNALQIRILCTAELCKPASCNPCTTDSYHLTDLQTSYTCIGGSFTLTAHNCTHKRATLLHQRLFLPPQLLSQSLQDVRLAKKALNKLTSKHFQLDITSQNLIVWRDVHKLLFQALRLGPLVSCFGMRGIVDTSHRAVLLSPQADLTGIR